MIRSQMCAFAMLALAGSAAAQVVVFPTAAFPHAANNVIPFGNPNSSHHQVYNAALFDPLHGGLGAVQIETVAFSPVSTLYIGDTWTLNVTIRMGYTDKVPGAPAPIGLELPSSGNNPSGPMTVFYDNPALIFAPAQANPDSWEFRFDGTPFVYEPANGNLLIEILTNGALSAGGRTLGVSRAAGSSESSRSYQGGTFTGVSTTTALRTQFTYTPVSAGCYPDCDTSTGPGVLDIFDFLCFGNRFSANDPYACDCDTSTGPGVCDIFDFLCFGNAFQAGCP